MAEQERPDQTALREKLQLRSIINGIGFNVFTQHLKHALDHLDTIKRRLEELEALKRSAKQEVNNLLHWHREREIRLHLVPDCLKMAVESLYNLSWEQAETKLRELSEEFQIIDLDATPEEEIAF